MEVIPKGVSPSELPTFEPTTNTVLDLELMNLNQCSPRYLRQEPIVPNLRQTYPRKGNHST